MQCHLIQARAVFPSDSRTLNIQDALDQLEQEHKNGIEPAIYVSLLRACGNARAVSEGKRLHAQIEKIGLGRHRFVGSFLVQMYGKCGHLDDARAVFDGLRLRNLFSWTIMIGAYAQNGHGRDAFLLFRKMELEGIKPDNVTFVNLLVACSSLGDLAGGEAIHARIEAAGFDGDPVVGNSLVNLYGRCRSLENARRVFEKMPRRNAVAWNAMIAGYAQNGHSNEALELYHRMGRENVSRDGVTYASVLGACSSSEFLAEGRGIHMDAQRIVPGLLEYDVVLGTALVNMYGKCGSLNDARNAFDSLRRRDVVAWTAMIAAYVQNGHPKEALDLYFKMQEQAWKPNSVTLISLLEACSKLGALAEGRRIHASAIALGLDSELVVGNAIIDMYGKCGCIEEAMTTFENLQKKNVISWSALISAYAQHGDAADGLLLFRQMLLEGIDPDSVTYSSILFVCSNSGMVDEASDIFVYMVGECGTVPTLEHYGCMIDLLSRAGRHNDAEELIDKMPVHPGPLTWLSLLSACQDAKQGQHAAQQVIELDPEHGAAYVLLANTHVKRCS